MNLAIAMNCTSCLGCKYLYGQGTSYSNYTWFDTEVHCALKRNPKLPADMPSDWNFSSWESSQPIPDVDNWPATSEGRCDRFDEGPFITLDIDGENGPAEDSDDFAQVTAICLAANRPPFGDYTPGNYRGDKWDYVPDSKPEAAALVTHVSAVRKLMH